MLLKIKYYSWLRVPVGKTPKCLTPKKEGKAEKAAKVECRHSGNTHLRTSRNYRAASNHLSAY